MFDYNNGEKMTYILSTNWFSAANKQDALKRGNKALSEKLINFIGVKNNNCYYQLYINKQNVELRLYDENNP